MLIRLIRNQPQGSAITGRLVINGRWFCNTLERVGYQIPALCYHIAVTQSPKFRRLLPIVQNVPRLPIAVREFNERSFEPYRRDKNSQSPIAYRSGIRFHRGTKPEHSTGCILVVADNPSRSRDIDCRETLSPLSSNNNPERELCCCERNVVENNVVDVVVHSDPCRSRDILISPDGSNDRSAYDSSGNNRSNECEIRTLSKLSSNNNSSLSSNKNSICGRSAADVEQSLTQLLLKAQNDHEEIILEVIDFRPGTDYGYDTPCPPELQKP